jgi:hypothetical protein
MPADGAMPKVSVSEAIKIVQSRRGGGNGATRLRMSGGGTVADRRSEGMRYREKIFGGRIAHMSDEEVSEEFYKSISAAVNRAKDEMVTKGWSRQDGRMIPPGYGTCAQIILSPRVEAEADAGACPHCGERFGLTFEAPSA